MATKEERTKMYMSTYEAKTDEERVEAYKTWAPHYEHHITVLSSFSTIILIVYFLSLNGAQDFGWSAPELCSKLLCDHLSAVDTAHVVDVAAGTGLVGMALAKVRYKFI